MELKTKPKQITFIHRPTEEPELLSTEYKNRTFAHLMVMTILRLDEKKQRRPLTPDGIYRMEVRFSLFQLITKVYRLDN